MSERAQAQLRALKEAAQLLFVQERYAECAEVHSRILRMVPKDPNARVRHAEICRRTGDRQAAIASYRMAAELLLAQGCEARARASLRAALELDPRDPVLLSDFTRMGQASLPPSTALEDERLYSHAAGLVTVSEAPVTVAPRTPDARVKTPPPPPPPFVLRAAEETRVSGPLPSAPAIAPVKVKPPGPATRAPVPSAPTMPSSFPPRGAVAPRQVEAPREIAVPVVRGTLVAARDTTAPRTGVLPTPSQAPRATTIAPLSPAQASTATMRAAVSPTQAPHATASTSLSPAQAPRATTIAPLSPAQTLHATASAPRPPAQAPRTTTIAPMSPAQAATATMSAAVSPAQAPRTTTIASLSPAQAATATMSAAVSPAQAPRATTIAPLSPAQTLHATGSVPLSLAQAPRTTASASLSPAQAPHATASALRSPAQALHATASPPLSRATVLHTTASASMSPAQALHTTVSASAPVPRETPKVEVSASLWTTGGPVTVTPVATYRPELRWLSPNSVAMRVSPQSHWVIIRAEGPLSLSRAESLPLPPRDVASHPRDEPIADGTPLIAH
ncbi:hypothetical protein FJV41_08330 [Myxococcus llanfairpwllgwyngyllgogerychwyrndrobwllllantysiliogogogochensis]|uniref:Bacterial transcriptional activator domain-containing protein n=1 Tax=Myxococcus llanfairpwllgwyngyllgogerychwyrndrobwllllantysiliogogogochensis TaxID=2590453 RepID=A0A540X5E4_9BACT|nr:hypothetical protein [Myxococcus llanfairpwllgwyngyllgogerychwyrndrobwllllantysiliogogogochensis]TQF16477.1 hypothetical protein FJV41_08330 [Myxococcus llanfairpwllgwyngyllgogerychwyrndrobwllllantysiliogogogochensis]